MEVPINREWLTFNSVTYIMSTGTVYMALQVWRCLLIGGGLHLEQYKTSDYYKQWDTV